MGPLCQSNRAISPSDFCPLPKPDQVQQVRDLIVQYQLAREGDGESPTLRSHFVLSEPDSAFIVEWIETAKELGRPIPELRGWLRYA